MINKQALALLLLLGSIVALSACGRSSAEIYRAYNLTTLTGAKGQTVQDLGAQNRLSLQTGGENTYFYSVPEQEDFINPDEKKLLDAQQAAQEASAEESEESNEESEDLDETALPDDAPTEEIEDKIDALQSDIEDALN